MKNSAMKHPQIKKTDSVLCPEELFMKTVCNY